MARNCSSRLRALLTVWSSFVTAFYVTPRQRYRFVLFQAIDNPIDNSNPNESSSSWHFLPNTLITQNTDDILHGCDAVVTTLDAHNAITKRDCWLRSIDAMTSNDIKSLIDTSLEHAAMPPKEALTAIVATHRWAANFVRPLQLCPWAGSSLDTDGAIRYWVVLFDASNVMESEEIFDEMERVAGQAGRHLEQITSVGTNPIDAAAAISFVILAPMNADMLMFPDFVSFHEFFLDLEDRLLDECDTYWDNFDDHNDVAQNESDIPDECKITLAAFHPDWRFNTKNSDSSIESTSAIDYEKRTPYPTISIVMSSVIDALIDPDAEQSEDGSSSVVTNRIAASNEKTLCKLGVDRLKEMYKSKVICPMPGKKLD